jgi:acyl transferase domain-containing protein
VLLEVFGGLFTAGVTPDWRSLYAGESPSRVSLPTYPFQRDTFTLSRVPARQPARGGMLGLASTARWAMSSLRIR